MAVLGCGEGDGYTVAVRFSSTDLSERVTQIRVRVLATCEASNAIENNEITLLKNGEATGALGNIEPGRYGIEVIGYTKIGNQLCDVARGCREQTFEAGGEKSILVALEERSVPVCVTTVEDGGVDPETDAGPIVRRDARVCAPLTEVCNNDDDDCDGRVDETTNKEVDRANCGACNNICSSDLTCAAGSCEPPIVEIAPGGVHTCARRENGRVFCWGDNSRGQLGNGTYNERLVPALVPGITDAEEISSGKYHTCVRRPGGVLLCWGDNDGSQLATTPGLNRNTPVTIDVDDAVVSLGMGFYHSCVVTDAHDVRCWGWNGHGQLARPFATEEDEEVTPTLVPNLHDVARVDGGWTFTCARHQDGRVSCWGSNVYGQLGDGTTTNRFTVGFVKTAGGAPLEDAIALSMGADHACVLREDDTDGEGTVLCWGNNERGAVGNGSFNGPLTAPTSTGVTDAVEIGSGLFFSCARRRGGVALCWGMNQDGQLGINSRDNRSVPVAVSGLANARSLYVDNGDYHTCAIREDLTVACWGSNTWGQLGIGTRSEPHLVPRQVSRL